MFHSTLGQALPVLFLMGAAAAVAQQPSKILVATGKETSSGMVSPGVLECADGQPTGRPFQCSPGTKRIFIWNSVAVQVYQEVAGPAAAMMNGRSTIVMHCNLDENYYGHCWGTFDLEVPEMGGKWEGTWSGVWVLTTNLLSYRMTGYGSGGQLEGLRLEKETVAPGGTPLATFVARVSAK